ncbi:Capsule polysaccharide export protein [Acidisarcina polymorpha]|uniref:Capsule polysaccharide export protein n=1 Tax=Acidisarcina polymorpha TaxID=2211140 RepID=A0A2Z5G3J2_9BACT|nr:polysaccharide biosynthesis/export family protein [Acidisarcina polymorpha]AXC13682.1 Capsule polysaccharide export protein [Acidisarcina polymorpha]
MRTLKLCLLVLFIASTMCYAQNESLLIGPGDVLHVQFYDTPDMEQHPRVSDAGDISLLFLGQIHVAGLSATQAARAIEAAFAAHKIMRQPQVILNVETYATQAVTVTGQVHTPGAYPISTPRSVVDVLTLAGGLSDDADRNITIERRGTKEKIPYFLSNHADRALDTSVMVNPGDTIIVPKAGLVYVLGDVSRPGGYVLDSNNDAKLTVLQMVAVAGGTLNSAVPSHTRLLRKKPDGSYEQTPVPLGDMQKGKAADVAMQANDVLFVPFSYLRNFLTSGASGVMASTSGAAIYHF